MDHHGLPTPRTTLAASYVVCWSGAKAAAGIRRPPTCRSSWRRADVPLIHLKYRCSNCSSRLIDFNCTSRYGGRAAWNHDGTM